MFVTIDHSEIYKTRVRLKNVVQNNPDVINVSLISGEPGGFPDIYTFETESKPG